MSSGNAKRRVGPFELGEELGVGGMGIVYRAVYLKNGAECAVKLLAPDLTADVKVAKRFERETEILKKLNHPNIVKYYGAGSAQMQRFYAMELVRGGSLEQVLRREGRLNWERVIEYALQIAKALEHAHNAGIIHRDLKPANLLLTEDGVLKLTDFGIARDTQATALTQAGKTVGTMMYMAPEQITGKYPINRSTDLYALGCVLFQMLTGKTPFESNSQAELLFKHIDEVPPSVLDFVQTIPLSLARLINELLAKDPKDRPFDALAVQVKLDEIVAAEKARAATIADGMSLTGHAASTIVDITPPKKKKKKQQTTTNTPFYERIWFLGTCLAVMIGLIIWGLIPEGEDACFARLQSYMDTPVPTKWIEAEQEINRFRSRYPNSPRLEQVNKWDDQIDMYRVEKALDRNMKAGRDPVGEAEKLYVEALQFERFGDRMSALEKYEAMPKLLEPNDENKPYLGLAERQAGFMRGNLGTDIDRAAFIRDQLKLAEEMYLDRRKEPAREKWYAIVKLYGNKPEFESLTEVARTRLRETEPGLK